MKDLVFIPPRRPDWRARLTQFVAEAGAHSFRPGVRDCALFAADAVEVMTGFDPAADLRGTYRTLEAGYKALRELGFRSHTDFAASQFEAVPPAFANVGDLAVLPGDGGDALGVFQGASIYCLTPSGMACVSRLHAKGAFKV